MTERLCMFCVHYQWSEPHYYSENTSDDGIMTCSKNHYEATWHDGRTLEDLRKAITFAKQCPDYEQVKP